MAENEFKPNDKKNKKSEEQNKTVVQSWCVWIFGKFNVYLDELLQNTQWMEEATQLLDRPKTSRMEILCKAAEKDCTQQC